MEPTINNRLIGVVALAARYCNAIENAREMSRLEFVQELTILLPRIYSEFADIDAPHADDDEADGNVGSFVDNEYYDSVRIGVETLMGEDDTYLETFEEDMKYSDTPIGASISEGLADIFQVLYDFAANVRESGAEVMPEAYAVAKEHFDQYWSQTLCNVMRPLNHLRTHLHNDEEDY